MKVLVTGGAGYIGSHACVVLTEAGHDVVVFDNLSNSSEESLRRVEQITGRPVAFELGDIRDREIIKAVLKAHSCEAVIHFAGLKSPIESAKLPVEYYDVNFNGSLQLVQAMRECGVKKLIFSSTANIYGEPQSTPQSEEHPIAPNNPYGHSKAMVEQQLGDLVQSDSEWSIAILRYFNPVGAHESGLIGESPIDTPNNLVPYLTRVAVGELEKLSVFGDQFGTPDGTGIRDYIHVMDLAEGHLAALTALDSMGCSIVNLGTGRGYSVLEMIAAFEAQLGHTIPYDIAPPRAGDAAESVASVDRANEVLGWRASRGLEEMCRDAWNWTRRNPTGY